MKPCCAEAVLPSGKVTPTVGSAGNWKLTFENGGTLTGVGVPMSVPFSEHTVTVTVVAVAMLLVRSRFPNWLSPSWVDEKRSTTVGVPLEGKALEWPT